MGSSSLPSAQKDKEYFEYNTIWESIYLESPQQDLATTSNFERDVRSFSKRTKVIATSESDPDTRKTFIADQDVAFPLTFGSGNFTDETRGIQMSFHEKVTDHILRVSPDPPVTDSSPAAIAKRKSLQSWR